MKFWEWHDRQPRWVQIAIPTVGFILTVIAGIWFFSTFQVFVAY